jgi:hypothetical protein
MLQIEASCIYCDLKGVPDKINPKPTEVMLKRVFFCALICFVSPHWRHVQYSVKLHNCPVQNALSRVRVTIDDIWIAFIDDLEVVTTSNCNTIAIFLTLKITTEENHISR